jgi:hypothetical protein
MSLNKFTQVRPVNFGHMPNGSGDLPLALFMVRNLNAGSEKHRTEKRIIVNELQRGLVGPDVFACARGVGPPKGADFPRRLRRLTSYRLQTILVKKLLGFSHWNFC